MKAIKSTWKTLTDTLSVVGRYNRTYLYPLLSFIIMLLVTLTIMIPLLEKVLGAAHAAGPTQIFFFLVVFFMYGLLYFVTSFFNVAMLTRIAGQLEGDNLPFNQGILAALQRMGPIARYTLVSASLDVVAIAAKVLTNPFLGGVIIPLIGKQLWLRWRQLSYNIPLLMALPVITLDQPVPAQLFKRSGLLVKETWGERVKPAHSLNLVGLGVLLIVMLFAIPTLRQGSAGHNPDLIRLGASVLLVSILIFTQLSGWVNAIFALAAYRYATARKSDLIPGDASYAKHAFVKPKKDSQEEAAPSASLSGSPPVIADDPSN